ncbi:hypothetical protein [Microbacterium sp. WCS2018Hpa-9]|uniref:hypothetical protein n=2 Tax=unclassified Microbacterium TaxID=2609290 RepID=UPI002888F9B0|nr:hypothetical protein [Microbacterium sp. WCS2018Hpa-9]
MHLDKGQRQQMLTTMVNWGFDRTAQHFVTDDVSAERLQELIHAVIALGPISIRLSISHLTRAQFVEVFEHLHPGSELTLTTLDPTPHPLRPTHAESTEIVPSYFPRNSARRISPRLRRTRHASPRAPITPKD